MFRTISIVAVIILILIPCVFAQQNTYTVKMIDGVKYVHNTAPLWGEKPEIRLRKMRMYGKKSWDDENYHFTSLKSLTMDDKGILYVLDSGMMRIQKYGSDGYYTGTVELGVDKNSIENPLYLEVDRENGNLYVHDGKSSIVILDNAGKLLKRFNAPQNSLEVIRTAGSGRFIMSMPKYDINHPLIGMFDGDFNLIGGIGTKKEYGSTGMNVLGNLVSFTIGPEKEIYAVLVTDNVIKKYSPRGQLIWEASRPLNYAAGPREMRGKMSRAMVSIQIGVDYKERIWVATFERQFTDEQLAGNKQGEDLISYQIFNSEGVYLGKIPSRMSQNMQFVFGKKLYEITLLNQAVTEYEIVK